MVTLDLLTPSTTLRPADVAMARIDALYVHIPFCFHKCHYCDFYSITRQTPERMEAFVDLLLREADLWRDHAPRPRTIFFGGGTPSLLPIAAMDRLIRGLQARFDLSRLEEWTIEINPATADGEYLRMLRGHGVDRLSFGAQSFVPRELEVLERHHHPDDIERSIGLARDAGFERLNVDLIYAIPGQTVESWRGSLARAMALEIEHLSCYGLTYESNTPMTVRKRLGQFEAAGDELEIEMFAIARQMLAGRGIEWYEISNYASAGGECRHNLVYWTGGNYVGLGPSAASHVDGHRFKNRQHLREWEEAVPRGALPVVEHERLSPQRRAAERILLQLRLRQGLGPEDLTPYVAAAGTLIESRAKVLVDNGLLIFEANRFRLTDKGLPLADGIASELVGSFA